jgi:hypothetical protein
MRFSKSFVGLIARMLDLNESNRPDFMELEEILKKY